MERSLFNTLSISSLFVFVFESVGWNTFFEEVIFLEHRKFAGLRMRGGDGGGGGETIFVLLRRLRVK